MTISEFKAFLDGMDVKDQPTKEQWERIVAKLSEVEDTVAFRAIPDLSPPPYVPHNSTGNPNMLRWATTIGSS